MNKLWDQSGRKVSFKQFVSDYNNSSDGFMDPPEPSLLVEADVVEMRPSVATGQMEPTVVLKSYRTINIREGIAPNDMVLYGAVGVAVGIFVVLLVNRV